MSVVNLKEKLENIHRQLDEAAKATLGPNTIVVTCISVNGKESGQWVLCHPENNIVEVAKRLGVCATVVTDPDPVPASHPACG